MADGAVFDPATARWLVSLGKKLEGSQILNPGHVERVVLKVMPRFSGGGNSEGRIFKTPSGGIDAAVGSTWGSATCDEYDEDGTDISNAETIYNHRTSIIPGEVFILVLAVGAKLFVWEGNCPEVIAPP